jgi:hypothetical protein
MCLDLIQAAYQNKAGVSDMREPSAARYRPQEDALRHRCRRRTGKPGLESAPSARVPPAPFPPPAPPAAPGRSGRFGMRGGYGVRWVQRPEEASTRSLGEACGASVAPRTTPLLISYYELG